MTIKNWRGEDIAEPRENDIVDVWQITPHYSNGFSDCLIIGWQDMLEQLGMIAERKLEELESDDELREGIEIRVKLVTMPYHEYRELEQP